LMGFVILSKLFLRANNRIENEIYKYLIISTLKYCHPERSEGSSTPYFARVLINRKRSFAMLRMTSLLSFLNIINSKKSLPLTSVNGLLL
jgi:hypothetical protein